MPLLLAAPDKFRGTASAAQIADAIGAAARAAGWRCDTVPVSDGGEGLLECFGGANRATRVRGPLGVTVSAAWRRDDARAVIEMAQASGRHLVPDGSNPLAADTAGTGELIAAALDEGAREIVVGAGGSASTDGGRGAVDVLRDRRAQLRHVDLRVACDVRTTFVAAATVFGPQKGANPAQVRILGERLERLADSYATEFGVQVRELPGSGAAGGLAGGLAVLGARLEPGFQLVARHLDLAGLAARADLVVTGEGRFDATSLQGKVTGSIAALGSQVSTQVVVIAGSVAADTATCAAQVVDLSERFGAPAARHDVCGCVRAAVTRLLRDTPA